jgi:acetylornithine/succinyldiaminopimelate/putrescine aminotransferase
MGRTGKMFGVEHWNVVPDILCMGKALGGGVMPLSAFISTPKIWQVLEKNPFIHTSTFGGNPLACAAGIAAVNVTLEEDLPGQACRKGKYLLGELIALQVRYDRLIKRASGRGLLLGLEFPNTEIGYKVVSGLFRKNVLVAGTLTNSRVVRFEPALNIPDQMLDVILEHLEEVLKEIDGSVGEIVPEED